MRAKKSDDNEEAAAMSAPLWIIVAAVVSALLSRLTGWVRFRIPVATADPATMRESILVPLSGCAPLAAEIEFVSSLFRAARHPVRVMVASRKGVAQHRRSALQRACGPFSANVRFVEDDALRVRDYLELEQYTLLCSPTATMCAGWDAHLVEELRALEDGRAALTCVPAPHPTFLCVGAASRGSLSVRAIPLRRAPLHVHRVPVPSLLWSSALSFSASGAVLQCVPAAYDRDPTFAMALWTHGCSFYAPAVHVAMSQEYPRSAHRERRTSTLRAAVGKARSIRSFYDHVGINAERGTPTVHALCGLTRKPSDEERIVKYGSIEKSVRAVEAAKKRWEIADPIARVTDAAPRL